jgi:hypothetical protein
MRTEKSHTTLTPLGKKVKNRRGAEIEEKRRVNPSPSSLLAFTLRAPAKI